MQKPPQCHLSCTRQLFAFFALISSRRKTIIKENLCEHLAGLGVCIKNMLLIRNLWIVPIEIWGIS